MHTPVSVPNLLSDGSDLAIFHRLSVETRLSRVSRLLQSLKCCIREHFKP